MPKRTSLPIAIWIASLIIINLGIWSVAADVKYDNFKIYSLDIGQGDATLLITPDKKQILIDTGSNEEIVDEISRLLPLWRRTLDLVVITHWHEDHAGGLLSTINNFSVKELLAPRNIPDKWNSVLPKDLQINYADPADDYTWGDVYWDTLWPPFNWISTDDLNDDSVTAIVSYKGTSLIFMGDTPSNIEQEIVSLYPGLAADIIKIAHHGSKYSSSQELVDKLQVKIGLISVGQNNRYGHPHKETMKRWRLSGTTIYRTDQDGTIEIIIDSGRIIVIANGEEEFY